MSLFNKKKILVTHNSTFHADDVFATAALSILLHGNIEIIRSRDEAVIKKGDFVYDVGGIYDADKNRFDHHQPEGAGKRENGIPYAAFGLVWKKFGTEICGGQDIAERIDQKLVQAIDAPDNGVDLFTLTAETFPYLFSSALYSFRPTWNEDQSLIDSRFMEVVAITIQILKREIVSVRSLVIGEREVEKAYQASIDKRIIVLDDRYPWEWITVTYPEPLFVVAPRIDDGQWKAEVVRKKHGSMESRVSFPAAWAGLHGDELVKVTGVSGAVFCHRARFMIAAKTKEDVLALVNKALLA